MSREGSTGWSVKVTHPTSGRTIRPDVLEEPQFVPGPNGLPEIRVPVRRAPSWLSQDFDDSPSMAVYLDGNELPIDELVNVTDQQGRTVLVGEGGIELRDRVTKEYRTERRHVAVQDLIQTETSYDDDVDTPTSSVDKDVVLQNPSGEADLKNLYSIDSTEPLEFAGGGIRPLQTSFVFEGENWSDFNGATTITGTIANLPDESSDGDAALLDVDAGDWVEYDFSNDYTIPGDQVVVYIRKTARDTGSTGVVPVNVKLDGTTIANGDLGVPYLDYEWITLNAGDGVNGTIPSDVSPGVHTLRVEENDFQNDNEDGIIDVIAIADARYTYTLDNTVNTTGGYLDGPQTYPDEVVVDFDAEPTAFSYDAGEAILDTIDDTGNDQFLAISNDSGSSFPFRADNATSVSGDFADLGVGMQLRVGLSRHSPNGKRDDTPRTGYDPQQLDEFTLKGDILREALLIDENFDDSLVSIFNDIANEQYTWSYQIKNGSPTVSWTEYGQRTASDDPQVSDLSVEKKVETWEKVVIRGSGVGVSGEEFTSSNTFVDLNESNLVTGSEAVFDDSSGTQYERGTDYEIDYENGEIKRLSGGSLTNGNTFSIDYSYEVVGSHELSSAPADPKTLVEKIPGVISSRQAEQIAYVLLEIDPKLETPRYEGDLVTPRLDSNFDPLEALQLSEFDLPGAATPLSIRGKPELTPGQISIRLGSAPPLDASLGSISERVRSVSKRV